MGVATTYKVPPTGKVVCNDWMGSRSESDVVTVRSLAFRVLRVFGVIAGSEQMSGTEEFSSASRKNVN
jgi:hypothetical protein